MSALAIDFETANARRDSACAVGLAWIEDGAVVRRETRLIRPPTLYFAPGNIRIHGILPGDVREAPNCAEVLAEFLPDLTSRIVLAHNAGFDIGVLAASLAACGHPVPDLSYLCTVRIARRLFPGPGGCGLAAVAARLGIRFVHHDAGEDAHACAQIALSAIRETRTARIEDLAASIGLTPTRIGAGFDEPAPPRPSTFHHTSARSRGLRFTMRGSLGAHYDIVFEEAPAPYLRCSCPAGRHRMACRHVEALLDGDVTDLVSDNCGDVEKLRQRLDAQGGTVGPLRGDRTALPRPVSRRWRFG